jgi:hypothetical protein
MGVKNESETTIAKVQLFLTFPPGGVRGVIPSNQSESESESTKVVRRSHSKIHTFTQVNEIRTLNHQHNS